MEPITVHAPTETVPGTPCLLHHAIHADVAAVELHDMLDNREAEPGAAQFPGTALIHAIEPLEDTRQAFLWDAEACILHLNDRHAARSLRGNGNASARAIIFDGIWMRFVKS